MSFQPGRINTYIYLPVITYNSSDYNFLDCSNGITAGTETE